MRPSHQTSGFSSSPSLRREGRLFSALLASVLAWTQRPVRKIAPLLRDPYRGVALGVEGAWPSPGHHPE